MCNLLLFLLIAASASAAPPETYKISGKVEEFGLGAGLSDVAVSVERYEGKVYSSMTPKSQVAKAATSSAGTFAFEFGQPGTYRVTVQKEGFRVPGSPMDGFSPTTELTLDTTTPSKELTFHLARPAELSGTVVDIDTGRPIEGLPIHIGQFGYISGRHFLTPSGASDTTGPQGRFTLSNLVPSAHVLMIGPRLRSAYDLNQKPELKKLGIEDRFLSEFSAKDVEAVDMDYDTTYWPGGSSFENVAPITLPSGAKLNLGILAVRKIAKHRVLVSLAGSDCTGIGKVHVSVKDSTRPYVYATPMLGGLPCGGSALLRGFAPGDYDLELVTRPSEPGKPDLTASATVQVGHAPATVTIPFHPGVTITGHAVPAEGAKIQGLDGVRLLLQPVRYGGIRHALIPIDATGQFKIENVSMRDYRVRVSGIPATHYLQEVRYNGIPAANGIVQMNSGTPAHSLVLVFDDKPATLTGTVNADSKPVPNAHVVAVPWPAPEGFELFESSRPAPTDEKGNFSIAGLAPGKYRVIAVPADQRRSLQKPNELLRLLGNAETITLSQSQLKLLRLGL